MGYFFLGPRFLLRFCRAGRFWEGTIRVSGGCDVSENLKESPGLSHYALKNPVEVPRRSYTIHVIARSYFFQQFKIQI